MPGTACRCTTFPLAGQGSSQPGVIPDAVATDYASRWLTARYTFTPATVKTAHAQILTALHPSLTVAFTAQAEREATLVKEVQLSTQVTITTATVTHRTPAGGDRPPGRPGGRSGLGASRSGTSPCTPT